MIHEVIHCNNVDPNIYKGGVQQNLRYIIHCDSLLLSVTSVCNL